MASQDGQETQQLQPAQGWHGYGHQMDVGTTLVSTMPFVLVIAAIFCVFYFRFVRRRETEKTIRAAIERGQTLDVQVLEKLLGPASTALPGQWLTVGGIVLVFGGIGLAILGLLQGGSASDGVLGAAALVGFIGIGLVVAAKLVRKLHP